VSEEVAAPAAAAPVAETAVAASPEPSQAPAEQASSSGGGAAAVPAGAPAPTRADDPFPEVEWNSWDGTIDSLPESYRTTAQGVSDYYEKSYAEKAEEIATLRSMYAAMLSEDEDPRIGQMTSQLEDLQRQLDERNLAYSDLEKTMATTEEQAVGEYVDRFWKDHADLAENKEKLSVFAEFLAEDDTHGGMWDAYVAAELIDLPESAVEIAIQAKTDGVSDQYALKLAKAHAELEEVRAQPTGPTPEEIAAAEAQAKAEAKAKAPRAGAKITNGATRSSRPQVAKKSINDSGSLDEMRLLAARRAFSVHGGGRR